MNEQNAAFSFLGGIDSAIIGFGFSIPILLFFLYYNREKIKQTGINILIWAAVLYPLCVVSGIVVDELIGVSDRLSAIFSGIINPIIISLVGTYLLQKVYKPKGQDALSDHLIDEDL